MAEFGVQICMKDSEVVNLMLHMCVSICSSSKILVHGKTNKLT